MTQKTSTLIRDRIALGAGVFFRALAEGIPAIIAIIVGGLVLYTIVGAFFIDPQAAAFIIGVVAIIYTCFAAFLYSLGWFTEQFEDARAQEHA